MKSLQVIGLDDDLDNWDVAMPGEERHVDAALQRAEALTLYRVSQAWVKDLMERSVRYTMTKDAAPCESCGQK
jgi:hypothetical protein